jgi:CRISPR/Cas system-associated exonuclease Cas4 (RecB family)
MNQGEQLPIKALKVFAQGNAMHEKWYKLFKIAGIDVAIERSLFLKKYDLSFTIDALLNLFNEEIICDVKSQNSFAFKKSKGHPSGEKQVNFYLWALSKYTGVPHRKGFVLVDSKDDQEIRIVPVKYNKEKVVPYVERLKAIQDMKKEFMESKELPKRKCANCDTKRASQCNMRDACFNIGKGRIKLNVEKKS